MPCTGKSAGATRAPAPKALRVALELGYHLLTTERRALYRLLAITLDEDGRQSIEGLAMESRNWLSEQTFVGGKPVPGWPQLLLSIAGHGLVFLAFAGWLVLQRPVPVVVSPPRAQLAKSIPVGTVSLPPRAQRAPLQIPLRSARQRAIKPLTPQAASNTEGTELQALRARAREESKGILQDFEFRGIYGFSLLNYELPFQISGEMPVISAEQLPVHYEQYVIVEVTVNSEGRVADARVVSGEVDTKIQQTLLAAIREFKYRPAKREGIPIPSQLDIVIHIPT